MPETGLVTTLAGLSNQLAGISKQLGDQEAVIDEQKRIVRRLRWMLRGGLVVFVFVAAVGAWGYVLNANRVDDIQDSRVEACGAGNRLRDAVIDRDEDVVRVAVQVAEASPVLADTIIDRLDELPSREALLPTDCEEILDE